jgi:LysM repeat protein
MVWVLGFTYFQMKNATKSTAAPVQEGQQASAQTGTSPAFVSVPYIPAPNSIDLCGEPVPLNNQEVYERFDKEFTLVVYNYAQVYLWLKRMERYFPAIEERLRYYNLPDDLKYVAIVESDLIPNACSPKGAAGPWQFMPSTGSAYGLAQKSSVDKRYDFECSTDSAFLYLNDLYKKYGNWSLAIAAYNCGDKRILDQIRAQKIQNYYFLKLPKETERYVFRILAVKVVLSNPNQYGYNLPKGWGYQEFKVDRVSVSLSKPTPIQTLANAAGITYREFKRLNPVFRGEDLPAGTHEIKLPMGTGQAFEGKFKSSPFDKLANSEGSTMQQESAPVAVIQPTVSEQAPHKAVTARTGAKAKSVKTQSKSKKKVYLVKKGDNLSVIAEHHKISTQYLKAANRLKSVDLTPGQKLVIP